MPNRNKTPCNKPGCRELVTVGTSYCDTHKKQVVKEYDERRGSAHERGYTKRWHRYRTWFLRQPGNQICKLRLDAGCTMIADCVDHVDPPNSADDPKFWDTDNHQAACIHCNSVKGHKKIIGSDWQV